MQHVSRIDLEQSCTVIDHIIQSPVSSFQVFYGDTDLNEQWFNNNAWTKIIIYEKVEIINYINGIKFMIHDFMEYYNNVKIIINQNKYIINNFATRSNIKRPCFTLEL